MKMFFSPGIALMKRMGFSSRFTMTGLLLAAVLAFFLFELTSGNLARLRQLEAERAGAQFIGELVEWNKVLIDYRRIAITSPVGDQGVKDRLGQQAAVVDKTLAKLQQISERHAALFDSKKGVEGIRDGWKELQGKVVALPVDAEFAQKAFAAHGKEFGRLYAFMRDLGDSTGMALEPNMAGFYLGFPLANNTPKVAGITVRIAAYETLNIARGDIKANDKIFYEVTEALWKDAFGGVETLLGQAFKANPAIKERIEKQLAEVKAQGAGLLEFTRKNFIKSDAIVVSQADVAQAAQAAIDAAWALVDVNRTLLDEVLAAEQTKVRSLLVTQLGLALGAILVAAYLFMAMFLSIADATGRLGAATARLAEGDFTARAGLDGNDELTQVARRFDEMAQTLGGVMAATKNSAAQVLDASRGLSAAAGEIAKSSHAQAEVAQSTAASLDQVAASVGQVAENVESAVAVSLTASDAVDAGQVRMTTAVAEVRRVADSVGQAAERVTDLGRQTDAIGAIVSTIKDIADQTNLLALNAAIEAARAGESGRGFAVVADEVRKLAENTRRATDEIAAVIGTVQAGLRATTDSMAASQQQVMRGVSITDEAAGSLDGIRQNTQSSLERVRDIAHVAEEQRRATDDIARNVERIAQMADENDHSISGVTAAAEQLRKLSEALTASVARFKVSS